MPKEKIYVPIEVNANKLPDFGYLKDNKGDNISDKNAHYCELTALYWAWKNLDCDIIGICHYRRYLSTYSKGDIRKAKTIDDKLKLILSKKEIISLLQEYDVLAPTQKLITKNVYTKYQQQHHIKDLDNCRKIIKKKYPDYVKAFDKIMNDKEYCICNMCVMDKRKFGEYCEWLFGILFELEKITDLTDYTPLQKRIYGFLSERLFNVWLEKNQLKIKKLNIVALEHDSIQSIINKSYHRILHKKL